MEGGKGIVQAADAIARTVVAIYKVPQSGGAAPLTPDRLPSLHGGAE